MSRLPGGPRAVDLGENSRGLVHPGNGDGEDQFHHQRQPLSETPGPALGVSYVLFFLHGLYAVAVKIFKATRWPVARHSCLMRVQVVGWRSTRSRAPTAGATHVISNVPIRMETLTVAVGYVMPSVGGTRPADPYYDTVCKHATTNGGHTQSSQYLMTVEAAEGVRREKKLLETQATSAKLWAGSVTL